ncbi:Sodium/calcium exchanger membrane region [Penicillium hispanicum]|uniref:Sodium/calcium exchanger membrane region n=1 Tax=Penicillium hispanicum TaxID=1080232 RepID=UPI002540D53A|nr:Sodium/calcium exchanger membrane region [Penicillium hispanicum]KAJ5577856.1 Sodium/calcium exchanger membrane region [Penicillium hispanicum]
MSLLPSILQPAVRKGPRYSVRPFCATVVVFVTIAAVTWALGRDAHAEATPYTAAGVFPAKRDAEPECRLVGAVKDQCAYVRTNCPDHEDGLFSYLQLYYCDLADAKPLAFTILILWLSLLFSTIGIAASDFLCIDLSTLASILGLSESLTGVTFLAFGNGSPDVFSTFAAMRSNSGSLAIGELIGAASFITSVVAGSMAMVRPFKVARRSFVRDVGYFAIAVGFSMFLLADGRLHVWESAAMVGLYVFYVVMVVTWHWYLVRRRQRHERDVAARTHFHIPDNQELDVEQSIDDDDPGVGSVSRSLLRQTSTDDFDLLEPANEMHNWKGEEDEDDETRNRYLAEIRDNMHVYRPPNRSRRNTLNPIRPSLVGALEFQSVLHSLQKSRNISRTPPISLSGYSDDGETSSQPFDTRSIASHPRATRPSAINDRLSPLSAAGSSRARAVSANDAEGLQLDASLLGHHPEQTPRLTVRRPSNQGAGDKAALEPPRLPRIDTSAGMTVTPSTSQHPRPNQSPIAPGAPQTPNHLAPPNTFNPPNYRTGATHDRSPLPVSPRGTAGSQQSGLGLESPSIAFPGSVDTPSAPSSRPPSIRLQNPASPSERLLVHDSVDDLTNDTILLKKWWPYSILPPPSQIGCTLFPTIAGWKSKGFVECILAIIAAPSVFLLTVTVPVIEPQGSESYDQDPVPAVIIEPASDATEFAPRVRLPADSPVLNPMGNEHSDYFPEASPTRAHGHGSTEQQLPSRPRWDSEIPAVPPPPSSVPSATVKDWNRWLISIQLFTGPFFFVLIAWTTTDPTMEPDNLILPSLLSLLFSFSCLSVLIITTRRQPWHQRNSYYDSHGAREILSPRSLPAPWRPFLSLLGFLVAISWIATIATEVVSLLKTLGVILNISDSLLGLTVFAVGNSLGDLVADITVARLGYPVMALSACFGGPMLNILLGVGLGGLYMTLKGGKPSRHDEILRSDLVNTAHAPYEIAISKMLIISGATLLMVLIGLLIVVPLNHWRMDRKIGWGLIVVWCACTLGNVLVEVVL